MNITTPEIESIAKFQSLQAGQYWRAKQDISNLAIKEGMVLLIESIRWVDDKPHTIVVRAHPDIYDKTVWVTEKMEDGRERQSSERFCQYRFLLENFLEKFEFEPDHQLIRNQELQNVQGVISSLQNELMEAQTNPALLTEFVESELQKEAEAKVKKDEETDSTESTSLPVTSPSSAEIVSVATGTVANAIGTGITEASIQQLKDAAGHEHKVATIKSKWIQGKTNEIASTIQKMTPYYQEQAAAALAQTEDVRTYVAKLMKGIESLDLYVGKDVVVKTIKTGSGAVKDIPLTIVQRKLLMDEEFCVWADVNDDFDYSNEPQFFDALSKNDSLLTQIFPTERCVLVMAYTRRYIDYGDTWTNNARNAENHAVFLLIRDGENIYRVWSPVESHLKTARLFPSKSDQDKIFRGMDGSNIKFEDVAYTDRLAAHELHALHYKRFLLLLCGLDHRLKLLGDFYEGPPTFHFVTQDFQDRYFNFLHDDDGAGMLPGEKFQSLEEWVVEKNGYLRSGSRVMCNWRSLITEDTAPGAFARESYRRDGREQYYKPENDYDIRTVYREKNSVCVDVDVSGFSYSTDSNRTFSCKVNISRLKYFLSLPYLCLDAVEPEELHRYIHNRNARSDHLYFIRLFKESLKIIQEERQYEQTTRAKMKQALADGNIATGKEADAIISQAVIAWRAANRGNALPVSILDGEMPVKEWKSLLDQMFMLAGEGKNRIAETESFVTSLGYKPLRLVMSGNSKLIVYAEPSVDERDDRLTPHVWVHRIVIERGKTKVIEKSRSWVVLPKSAASETTLHQWEGAENWAGLHSSFESFKRKQEVFALTAKAVNSLQSCVSKLDDAEWLCVFDDWDRYRNHINETGKFVSEPRIVIPIGVAKRRGSEPVYLAVSCVDSDEVLYQMTSNEDFRARLRTRFISKYHNKTHAIRVFDEHNPIKWELATTGVSFVDNGVGVFGSAMYVSRKNEFDPRLMTRLEEVNGSFDAVWIHPSLHGESFVPDQLLNIRLPDDYAPVNVESVSLRLNDKSKKPLAYMSWYDIAPQGVVMGHDMPPTGFGKFSSTRRYISIGDALSKLNENNTLIASVSLPDMPQPPEGVKRWFVVEPGN